MSSEVEFSQIPVIFFFLNINNVIDKICQTCIFKIQGIHNIYMLYGK